MDQALRIFLEDYKVWLDTTKKEYNKAKILLGATKQLVAENQESIKSLETLRCEIDKLFQKNYMLMESHLHVHNVYSWYSDEDKKIIDEYKTVNEKVDALIREISAFLKSYTAIDEDQTNAEL